MAVDAAAREAFVAGEMKPALDAVDIVIDISSIVSLHPSTRAMTTMVADMLGLTPVLGQLGVFPKDTLTEAHAHKLAVLNLNIRGSKVWRMAPPGHLGIDFKENICFQETQDPGEWIYIPPGWSHEVRTVSVEQVQESELACSWSVMIAPVHLLDSIMKADMAIVEKLKARSGRTGKLTAAMRRELEVLKALPSNELLEAVTAQ